GDAFLETVKLIGSDEMHLSRQAGTVTGPAQVVGESRNGRRKLRRVVPGADRARELPAHHRDAGASAQRGVAILALKQWTVGRQALEIGRLQHRMAVAGERTRRELVEHDKKNVRPSWRGRVAHRKRDPFTRLDAEPNRPPEI